MNHSTPGLPVHHQLPESTQTHVHWVGDAIQPPHPLSFPSPALNQHIAIGHIERCLTSLITGDMQIKTTKSYHITPVRMAINKKTNTVKGMEKRKPLNTGWEHKLVQPLWKTVWRFLKTLQIEELCDPAIPLLVTLLKNTNLKRNMHLNVHSSTHSEILFNY